MSERTLEEIQAFAERLKQLGRIGDEFDAACKAEIEASNRRNAAHAAYVACYVDMEAKFPNVRMPFYAEWVWGPKPVTKTGPDMSTLTYCAKQATAMAEFGADRTKARLDAAIDAEESRDELIAARAAELTAQRIAAMAPIDIVAGMQSVMEMAAEKIRPHLIAGRIDYVGTMVRALIHLHIKQDSEVMAVEWMERIERELSAWEH